MADALSHRSVLLTSLDTKLLGFEYIKYLYSPDPNFLVSLQQLNKEPLINFIGTTGSCSVKIKFVYLNVL